MYVHADPLRCSYSKPVHVKSRIQCALAPEDAHSDRSDFKLKSVEELQHGWQISLSRGGLGS